MYLHIEHPTPVFTSFTLEWGPLGAIVGTLNQIGELGLTVDRHTQKLKKYPKKSLYVLYGSHTRLLTYHPQVIRILAFLVTLGPHHTRD